MHKYVRYAIIIAIIMLFLSPSRCFKRFDVSSSGRIDTLIVERIDTIRDTIPVPSYEMFVRHDTVYLPTISSDPSDSGRNDSIPVVVPITQKEYRTDQYHAYVSGYRAKLDSIDVYARTQTVYLKEPSKRKRWGLGLQVGYGMAGNKAGPYVGVGVSYNLFQW